MFELLTALTVKWISSALKGLGDEYCTMTSAERAGVLG